MKVHIMEGLRKWSSVIASSLASLAVAAVIAGCGGGGSGGDVAGASQGPAAGVSAQAVSGVAATGSPLVGQVTLRDSSSEHGDKVVVIANDGSFSIDVSNMKPPYLLKATGTANGARHTLYSFADGPGTANVNPFTNIALANAAGVDDPATVFEQADPATLERLRAAMADSMMTLRQKILPLLMVFSADGRDPYKQSFSADHDGLDAVFDSVRIVISNGILTITNADTGAVILTAQVKDIAHGTFTIDDNDLPKCGVRPAAPTGVQAVAGDGRVTVSWDPVPNATSYDLFYTTKSNDEEEEYEEGKWFKNVTSPYIVTGLAPNTTYFFRVRARVSFLKGPASDQVSATTTTTTPAGATPVQPGAPINVSATGGTNQVTVSWPAVMGATSYNLYWSDVTGVTTATGTQITGATSPAVITGLADDATYYVIVTAVNGGGESDASVQVAAATLPAAPPPTTAPAAPTGVSAVGGNEQVTVSWPAVSGATSYNIYWSTTTGVTPLNGTSIAGVTSPYVHTGLTASTSYFYVVTAVNSVGESDASLEATATTNAPAPALPAAPTGVTAAGGNQQVTVNWNAVSGATSYNLYWSTSPGVTVATGTKIASVTSPFAHTGLADSTPYYYVVTAVNGAGEGPASGEATATTNAPALDGAALYGTYCSGCHGPLATSSKKGKTAAQISSAIASIGMMSSLSTLTSDQIAAIAAALATP